MKVIINETLKKLLVDAFMNGYESGHDDTVESSYTDAEERANDWFIDAYKDSKD